MIKQMMGINGALTTTFLVLLAGGAYMDMRNRRIPDLISAGIFLAGLLGMACPGGPSLPMRVAGVFAASIPLILAALFVPGSFGGGDIKLMAACGMFLGAAEAFYSLFLALVFAGFYGGWLMIVKKKSGKERIAFGPFLAVGIAVRLVFAFFNG